MYDAEPEYPAFYSAADSQSAAAQSTFLRLRMTQLVLGVTAAVGGAFTWVARGADWFGVIAVVCFSVAAVIQGVILKSRPERSWYEGRAAAESAKSLTWRYAVRGDPFASSDPESDRAFISRIRKLTADLNTLEIPSSEGSQITAWMRSTRESDLEDRMSEYRQRRIKDQQSWYSRRSNDHRRRAVLLGRLALLSQTVGIVLGVLKAAGATSNDLLGICVAVATSLVAWSQTRQHESNARAYAIASHELASIDALLSYVATDDDWARFVDEAEEAISREHTLWRASALEI